MPTIQATGGAAPSVSPQAPAESRWVVASTQVRDTARWVVTTAAGAAAVIFGGAPLIGKADLTGEYVPARVALILLSATVGVLGFAGIIGVTARVLLPYETTLAHLPPALKLQIRRDPGSYLPGDLQSVHAFRKDLQWWSTQARQLAADVTNLEARLATAKALPAKDPTKPRQVAALEADMPAHRQAADIAAGNVAIFERARDDILGQASFTTVRDLWAGSGEWLMFCGVLAVIGAASYVMLIGFEPEEDEPDPPPERPVLALLTRNADGASDALWTAADLASCEVPGEEPVVPVLLEDGTGTPEAPYVVQTLGVVDGCPIARFSVIGDVATVTIPDDEVTITYQTTTTTDGTTTTEISQRSPRASD
jgi:hypothetical protein